MRPALLAVALLPLTAAAAQTPALPKPCERPGLKNADQRQTARIGKLGDMPPGTQLLAMYNEVNGCPTPIVVRDSVGMPERPTRR